MLLHAENSRIDCLSIIQDDPIDKAFLILNMNAIYERSALTIISAAGKGLDASLPGITPREPAAIKPAALESIPHRQKPINIALVAYSAQNLLTRTAWATRGWCYQEHVLSPRCLCFTPTECFFTCDDGLWREAYSTNGEFRSTIKGQIVHGNERRSAKTVRGKQAAPVATFEETRLIYPLSNAKADVSFPEYCEAVYDYTGRELTWKTDVFNAFAGMLATFGSGTPPYHCMPLSVFEHALCWQEAGDSEKLKPGSSDLPRALAVKRDPAQVIDLKSKKVIATEVRVLHALSNMQRLADQHRLSIPTNTPGRPGRGRTGQHQSRTPTRYARATWVSLTLFSTPLS